MIRVLHLADVHLGVETSGRPTESGLNSRVHDVLDRLDEVVAFATTEAVDLVCLAGDAFRGSRPAPTLETMLAERLTRLTSAGVAVLIVAGDHDQPRWAGHRSPLDIYPTVGAPGIHIARTAGAVEVTTRRGPVVVACVPHGEGDVAGAVVRMAGSIGAGATTFVAAHLAVAGATTSASQAQFGAAEDPVPLAAVANPRFPYVALGHVHRHQGDLHGDGP